MKTKLWYRSKTLWFNLIVLMLAAAEAQLNVLKGTLPGGLFTWLAFGLPIVNGLLRFISNSAIAATAASCAKANQ